MHERLTENKLGALWSVLDASMRHVFDAASPSTAAAILTLYSHAPLTGTALSRILRLSQPATVRLVEKLIEAGFVARDPRPEGKEIDLTLTRDGRTAAKKLRTARSEALREVLSPLTTEKRAQLAALLDEVLGGAVESRSEARFLCRFCDHSICDGPDCPIGCRASQIEQMEHGGMEREAKNDSGT